jgi:hypothetical protein
MLPAFLVGGLSGCSVPFAMLMVVAIASLFLSIVIDAEDMPISPKKINLAGTSMSRHSSRQVAFVHHKAIRGTSPAYLPLRMSDDSRITSRLGHLDEILSAEPVNHLNKLVVSKHYACPPTSLESLRKRYGTRQSLWGEWSNAETRAFYRTQLPRALQIDGALGLTLEERAQLASEARHALRVYSRERCFLPGRVAARIYDGLRHFQLFGYWSCDGMNWTEVKEKYARDAKLQLGPDASASDIEMYVYRKIVDRACATNAIFDHYASQGSIEQSQLLALIKGVFAVEKMKTSRPRRLAKPLIIDELEKQLDSERDFATYDRILPYEQNISNGDLPGCSLSMALALPMPTRSRSFLPYSLDIQKTVSDTVEEVGRIFTQASIVAISRSHSLSEHFRYLVESHVHCMPFY